MLGIPVEMIQFITKLLLKQRMAVHHDFHSVFDATKFLTAKLQSLYAKESESGVGNLERSELKLESDILPPTPQPLLFKWFPHKWLQPSRVRAE